MIKNNKDLLTSAIEIAASAFNGKKDKSGKPYILHCLHVMNAVSDLGDDIMIVAVLHDLFEDCPNYDPEYLYARGFPQYIVQGIENLTRRDNISYPQYIERIAILGTKELMRIKIADLEHNLDMRRINWKLQPRDIKRLQKYITARDLLMGWLNNVPVSHLRTALVNACE